MRISDWSSDVCSSDLHDSHHDKNHRTRSRGIKDLGQTLDEPEPESGDDSSHYRAHAANDDHGEDDDDQVGSHNGADLVDRSSKDARQRGERSEEHTSELQSLMRNSYAVFCLKKKTENAHVQH